MSDPTTQVVSMRASSALRIALCSGSVRAEGDLPEFGRDPSGAAAMGTAVHEYIEKVISDGEPSAETLAWGAANLDERGLGVADFCLDNMREVIGSHGGFTDDLELYTELPLEWASGEGHRLSGHPDVVAIADDGSVHIWDWKCGFASVKVAAENPQLMAYAVLLAMNPSFIPKVDNGVTVHLISVGNEWDDVVTSAHYSPSDLDAACSYLLSIQEAAADPKARRSPHPDACRYCRARGTSRCPESVAAIEAVAGLVDGLTDSETGKLSAPNSERVIEVWDACKVAEAAAENFKAMIRHFVEQEGAQSIDGLKLTNGFDQLIPAATADVATALERMLDYDSVVDCSSVSVGKLAEKLKAEKAVTAKAAKELVQRLLIAGGAASKIRRSGKLMRVKPKKKEGQ